jgi:hypothetical protein
MDHTVHHGRRGGRWGNGCERDHLGAHREARRCGRGRTGARLHAVRWKTIWIDEIAYRRNGRYRCRNQP